MLFSSRKQNSYELSRSRTPLLSGLFVTGFLSLLFGIAILLAPDLLAYIVASFFILVGISLLMTWNGMRK